MNPTVRELEVPEKAFLDPPYFRGRETSLPPAPREVSFSDIFGNGNPVEVEIGCGKGRFLVERAAACPSINFLGLDYAKKWMSKAGEIGSKRNLPNLKFIRGHAREFVTAFPPGSVAVFHFYFPDPWPKRRHQRRRLITEDFLEILWHRLVSRGLVEIATDHAGYYQDIKKAIARTRVPWPLIRHSRNQRLAWPQLKTHYEIKYEKDNRPLYYLELQKP